MKLKQKEQAGDARARATDRAIFLSAAMPLRQGKIKADRALIHELTSDLRHACQFWPGDHPEGGQFNFGEDQLLADKDKLEDAAEGKTVELEYKCRSSDGTWSDIPPDDRELLVKSALDNGYELGRPDENGRLERPGQVFADDETILVTPLANTYGHTLIGLDKHKEHWIIVDVCSAPGTHGFDNSGTAAIARDFGAHDSVISDNGYDRSGAWALGNGEYVLKMGGGNRSKFSAALVFFADRNVQPTSCYQRGTHRKRSPDGALIDVHVTRMPVKLVTPSLAISPDLQTGGFKRAHGAVYYDGKDGTRVSHDPWALRQDMLSLTSLIELAAIERRDGVPVMAQTVGNLICNSGTLAWMAGDPDPITRDDELELARNGKTYQGIGVHHDGSAFVGEMTF